MTPRAKKLLAAVAAVALAVVIVVFAIGKREPPRTPTELVPTTWEAARTSPMHVAHVGKKKLACTECHDSGFKDKPGEASCARCHEGEAKHAHEGSEKAPTKCLDCHAFGAGKREAVCADCHGPGGAAAARTEKAAARATHVLARHAAADVACGACHDVHGEKGRTRVVLPDCAACHVNVSAVHGRAAASAPADAGAGVDSLDASAARFAADARAAASLREAGAPLGAEPAPGWPGAVCATCHAPHAGGADATTACALCHVRGSAAPSASIPQAMTAALIWGAAAAPQVAPRGKGVAGHPACVTCHDPHRARRGDARACVGCHADRRGVAAVAGHAVCVSCHAPHAPGGARGACATCHAGKEALSAARVMSHAACESCHDPHRPAESPALACARCHAGKHPAHPAVASSKGGPAGCTGCHAAHPSSVSASTVSASTAPASSSPAAACSSCHTKAKNDRAFHAAGATCTGCHTPHDFATATKGSAFCARCHGPKATAVAARPGHADCTKCHTDAHAPSKKVACATCHAEEQRTALRGHATCGSCHDAHSGSLGGHAACTSCHTEKSKGPHTAFATGCASCHRPHGPKGVAAPPPCTSCHAPGKLHGLHRVAAHAADCKQCHSTHAAPRSDRATCTSSCHVDRRGHQPEAQVCKGCHMFRQ